VCSEQFVQYSKTFQLFEGHGPDDRCVNRGWSSMIMICYPLMHLRERITVSATDIPIVAQYSFDRCGKQVRSACSSIVMAVIRCSGRAGSFALVGLRWHAWSMLAHCRCSAETLTQYTDVMLQYIELKVKRTVLRWKQVAESKL